MSKEKVVLRMIPTGLYEFDNIILAKGGFPQYSLNIVCGPPGSGKTIFSYQMLFFNVSEENKAICFTTLSEPPLKVLRYLQQFDFFDSEKFTKYVKLVDLGMVLRMALIKGEIRNIIDFIVEKIEKENVSIVMIDSFKAMSSFLGGHNVIRRFIYELGAELAALQCTTFLVGEYNEEEITSEPSFAVADGIIMLSADRKGYLRRNYLEILKMRGEGYFADRHRFLIDSSGIEVYPRLKPKEIPISKKLKKRLKLKTGVLGLDEMTNGGFYAGSTTLVSGPSGVGKTIFALQFLMEGIKSGQKGLFVSFEESPTNLLSIANTCEMELNKLVEKKKIYIYHCSPVELCIDRFHRHLMSLIEKEQPKRIVIDSIADISITIADPTNLKNYLLSLINRFSELGVTSILTSEITEAEPAVVATRLSVMIDTVIALNYKEEKERVNRTVSVLKMRGSDHDKTIKEFKITNKGIEIK